MTPKPASPAPSPRLTPDEWDQLRAAFQNSLMRDTSLAALAENIDGCVWPIRAPDENPAVYLGLDHAQVLARLQTRAQAPAVLDTLATILRGTLAFDESFGEMVEISGKAEASQDPVPRNLERLGIPADFPIALCHFSPGTVEFCQRENLVVIADFLAFSRSISRSVIVGGEFRDLLNAFSHVDESTIARFLPYRPKTGGLHLLEGLALIARDLTSEQGRRVARVAEYLSPQDHARGEQLAAHFSAQVRDMDLRHADGTPLARLVAPLDDPGIEPIVASMLRLYVKSAARAEEPAPESAPAAAPITPTAPATPPPPKRGFFQRLFGLGR